MTLVSNVTSRPRTDWARAAIAVTVLMLVYFAVSNHIDLFPFNNLAEAGPQLLSTLSGWAMFVPCVLLVRMPRPAARIGALAIAIVWLALQFQQWYMPYLFNRGSTDWFATYGYDKTLKMLPAISGHIVTPDVQHNILQLFSVLVIWLAALAVRQAARAQGGRDS